MALRSRSTLAFPQRPADIGAGGWRWTSHSPTGSGPEGSSPNELRFGSLVSLPLNFKHVRAHSRRARAADTMNDAPLRCHRRFGLLSRACTQIPSGQFRRPDRPGCDGAHASNAFESGRIPSLDSDRRTRRRQTTTARILARALNYELPDGSVTAPTIRMPTLGVHCQAIMESRHVDVLEMDAASTIASTTCARSTTRSATRRRRRATRSISSTKCTCSRAPPSTHCSKPWKSRRRTQVHLRHHRNPQGPDHDPVALPTLRSAPGGNRQAGGPP